MRPLGSTKAGPIVIEFEAPLEILKHQYGIPDPKVVRSIANGDWNRIYEVRGGGRWILRISHLRKTERQLVFELHVMEAAARRLPVVPGIRRTVNGEFYAVHDGVFYTLFQWMPGHPLHITDRTVRLTGAMLGRIHRTLQEIAPTLRLINDLSILDFDWTDNYMVTGDLFGDAIADLDPPNGAREIFAEITAGLGFLRSTRDKVEAWRARCLAENRLTEGITHGDYYRRNILMAEGRITAVLDWDETVTSWLEYEGANATWEFARDDPRARMNPRRVRLFLEAYEDTNPGLALDRRTLNGCIALRRLIEIQLALYELREGGMPDLDYCRLNVDYLRHLDLELG